MIINRVSYMNTIFLLNLWNLFYQLNVMISKFGSLKTLTFHKKPVKYIINMFISFQFEIKKKSNKDIITMVFFAIYTNTGQITHKACRP